MAEGDRGGVVNMGVVLGRTQADVTSGNAVWETPPAVFAKLHAEFNFEIDLCADAKRALCPIWFGPGSRFHTDAHEAPWIHFGKTVAFCNPPYGPFVPRLLAIAAVNSKYYGFTTVFLLPMRATRAFHTHVIDGASELRFCNRRITFWEDGSPRLNKKALDRGQFRYDPAPFDSIIVVYRPKWLVDEGLLVSTWHVPAHTSSTPASNTGERHHDFSGPPLPTLT